MPLLILVGCPASGKSTRAAEIKEFFETQHEKNVHIISENDIIKNSGIPKVRSVIENLVVQQEVQQKATLNFYF